MTSHSCRNISEAISSVELQVDDVKSNAVKVAGLRFTGDGSSWSFLPRAYVVRPFETAVLLLLDWTEGVAQIQALSWYIASHDTMYQGILSVAEIPGSSFLIFSMQRDSEPVVYDPATRAIVRKLKLGRDSGAPQLFFLRKALELWASNYDTMVRLDTQNWGVLSRLKLQEGRSGMASTNIGKYHFDLDESLCLVARPHSGDIVGIDPNTFTVTRQVETGGQPEDVGLLRGGLVVARDLKTGRLLKGTLRRI